MQSRGTQASSEATDIAGNISSVFNSFLNGLNDIRVTFNDKVFSVTETQKSSFSNDFAQMLNSFWQVEFIFQALWLACLICLLIAVWREKQKSEANEKHSSKYKAGYLACIYSSCATMLSIYAIFISIFGFNLLSQAPKNRSLSFKGGILTFQSKSNIFSSSLSENTGCSIIRLFSFLITLLVLYLISTQLSRRKAPTKSTEICSQARNVFMVTTSALLMCCFICYGTPVLIFCYSISYLLLFWSGVPLIFNAFSS